MGGAVVKCRRPVPLDELQQSVPQSSISTLQRLTQQMRTYLAVCVMVFVLAGIFTVASVPTTTPLRTYSPGEHLSQQVFFGAFFLLTALLLGFPLWRYMQWVSGVGENLKSAELLKRGETLGKWVRFLRVLTIIAGVFGTLGLISPLIHFKPTVSAALSLLSTGITLAVTVYWYRLFRAAPAWIEEVQSGRQVTELAALLGNLQIVTVLQIMLYVVTFLQNIELHRVWLLFLTPLSGCAMYLFLLANRRFVAATSSPVLASPPS
ncbi:hypothetical protein MF271_04025 [Deinococcus sp. KNUC1210]|uniref:hypothetical protein n=1 Tax=Deinococcus sp. KNUC1210 TaxID=2917691 RepID=UPI001EEFFADE|nr:hypothetical protein [Deinococcus sp. KNUC1210]ULH15813.1 hypothetical protein MF271_04025 [Deinococcus sp. KNUC1210]